MEGNKPANRFEGKGKLLFALFALFLAGFSEVMLRTVLSDYKQEYTAFSEKVHHDYIPNRTFVTRQWPSDIFEYEPVRNEINQDGMRGPIIGRKSKYRVLFVGDSFLQADEVPYERFFVGRLSQGNEKLEFISHGMTSWSPTPIFSWIYHQGIHYEPDEVNLFVHLNDFSRMKSYHWADEYYRSRAIYEGDVPVGYDLAEEEKPRIIYEKSLYAFLNESRLFNLSARFVKNLYREATNTRIAEEMTFKNDLMEFERLSKHASTWPVDLKNSVDSTINVVSQLQDYLQENGVKKFNVFLVPDGLEWGDEIAISQRKKFGLVPGEKIVKSGLREYLAGSLMTKGINYIELKGIFDDFKLSEPEKTLFFPLDNHWNQNGHELLANHFASFYENR